MAKPISKIDRIVVDEDAKKQQDLQEIEGALADNKEAVMETLDLLGHLHDRGLLELMNGFFSQGDEVFRNVVKEINKPNHSQILENVVGLAGLLGSIDVQQLKMLTERANNGLNEAASTVETEEQIGVFHLLKALKDPEINRSIGMLMRFLKGMGRE
ncbi:MAG TPA: DUF1641 domain-containing protein [Bacillales bacterium]|nr:DUF1641 domain-containing protein [Bacillales bacterium]